jgi:hypothetical protein
MSPVATTVNASGEVEPPPAGAALVGVGDAVVLGRTLAAVGRPLIVVEHPPAATAIRVTSTPQVRPRHPVT